jgi:hypothetical protein
MKPSAKVASLLSKYTRIRTADLSGSVDLDFKKVSREIPPHVLGPNIARAFGSQETPSLSKIVAEWYKSSKKRERIELFGFLSQSITSSGLARSVFRPNLIADLETGDVSAQEIERIIASVEAIHPQVNDLLAVHFANEPKAMQTLDRGVQGEILRNLAENTADVVASIDLQSQAPSVEEVTKDSPPSAQGPAPPPRYLCVNLFEEQAEWQKGSEFDPGQFFRKNKCCLAEISVRLKPTGVVPATERKPLRAPEQKTDVELLVTAQSDDFKISPRVATVVLPPSGDSKSNPLFRIQPLRVSTSADDRLKIRFRIFYKYNLLQTLTLRGGALSELDDDEEVSYKPPKIDLGYNQIQEDANDFDLMAPRSLHIEVDPAGDQYELTFTFGRKEAAGELAIHARVLLNSAQLAGEIAGARKVLFEISSSETLGKGVDGDRLEFRDQLGRLGDEGRKLWSLLFNRGKGQEITTVGEWLKENPLPIGSTIQVTMAEDAAAFVFAWGLLYDGAKPAYSGKGFWGIRYIIEQRVLRPQPLTLPLMPMASVPRPIEIGAMYWQFSQTPDQQKYLLGLLAIAKRAKLALDAPINDAKGAKKCLSAGSSDILYFFTHGYTGLPNGETFGVTVQDFMDLYRKLPKDSSTQQAWRYDAERIEQKLFRSDQSWIELSSGRLELDDLYNDVSQLPLSPFVILNMCDSAQITPTLSKSFIDFFLTRHARAIVGTECSIRPVFADFVGRSLIYSLMSAKPIGGALRTIRVEAFRKRNLLGLAYTLFGSADAAIDPSLFVQDKLTNL